MSQAHPLGALDEQLDNYLELYQQVTQGDSTVEVPAFVEPGNLHELSKDDVGTMVELLAQTTELIAIVEAQMNDIAETLRKIPVTTTGPERSGLLDKKV